MKRLIAAVRAISLAARLSIAAIAAAQNMDKHQALRAKQQGIISSAVFTAIDAMEKLKRCGIGCSKDGNNFWHQSLQNDSRVDTLQNETDLPRTVDDGEFF